MNAQELINSLPQDRAEELKDFFYPKTPHQLADENITKILKL